MPQAAFDHLPDDALALVAGGLFAVHRATRRTTVPGRSDRTPLARLRGRGAFHAEAAPFNAPAPGCVVGDVEVCATVARRIGLRVPSLCSRSHCSRPARGI